MKKGNTEITNLPKAEIEIEVKDKNGKIIEKRNVPCKSWVGNLLKFLNSLFSGCTTSATDDFRYGGTPAIITDTSGANKGLCLAHKAVYSARYLGVAAPAGNTTAGIKVGSNDTPVSADQYNLISTIPHGSGTDQLEYRDTVVEDIVTDTEWYFRVIREFLNASGATITVKEIGLFIYCLIHTREFASFMLARDVLSPAVDIPDGAMLTVRYKISWTPP